MLNDTYKLTVHFLDDKEPTVDLTMKTSFDPRSNHTFVENLMLPDNKTMIGLFNITQIDFTLEAPTPPPEETVLLFGSG